MWSVDKSLFRLSRHDTMADGNALKETQHSKGSSREKHGDKSLPLAHSPFSISHPSHPSASSRSAARPTPAVPLCPWQRHAPTLNDNSKKVPGRRSTHGPLMEHSFRHRPINIHRPVGRADSAQAHARLTDHSPSPAP